MIHGEDPGAGIRPGSRERRRLESTERIVEAAADLIRRDGYGALTMQRLATRLGYAVGALYRYFDSKDALLVAVLGRALDRLRDDLLEARERVEATQAESQAPLQLRLLLGAVLTFETFGERWPEEQRVIGTALGDPRELTETAAGARVVPQIDALVRHFALLLDDAVDAGVLAPGDAEGRAAVLWAASHGSLQLARLGRLGLPAFAPRELAVSAATTLLRGWGAEPSAIEAAAASARRVVDRS